MRRGFIGILVMLLLLLGFTTSAYAVTITGDISGNNLVWQIGTSPGLTFINFNSSKDNGLDWICENGFANIHQSDQDISFCNGIFNASSDLFTFTTYNIYPGYYNQISTWVINSSTENITMPGPVLNWMGNSQEIDDYRDYILLADGGVIPYAEPMPDNALVVLTWGNNSGVEMEPGVRLQEGLRFHILSNGDTPSPSIDIVKEASVAEACVGDVVTYNYTVTNTGDVTLIGVTATDNKLGPITLAKNQLSPGEATGGTATYIVQEGDLPGPLHNTATATGYHGGTAATNWDDVSVTLIPCQALNGLTPGYWKNWRNHYTTSQFNLLLSGTIAPDITSADKIFKSYSAKPGKELTALEAQLLATQLTLNLTKMPGLSNPDGAFLNESARIQWEGANISTGEAVQRALDIRANPDVYTRSQILQLISRLDYINNL